MLLRSKVLNVRIPFLIKIIKLFQDALYDPIAFPGYGSIAAISGSSVLI